MMIHGVSTIRDLGKRYLPVMPQDGTLFQTCFAGVQAVMGTDDQRTFDIVKQRFSSCDQFLKAFLDVDEIEDIVDEDELEDMLDDKEKEKQRKSVAKQFSKEYKCKLRSVRGDPPKPSSKKHPLYGFKWAVKEFPQESPASIAQCDAKLLIPPGSAIWVGHASLKRKGSWCGHFPPYRRYSITWEAAGSERLAVWSVVEHLWRLFLTDNNLPLSHCPIAGIFSD